MTSQPPETDASGGGPALVTARLEVEGMHCESCVALISETLAELPGIASAEVDLAGHRAEVRFDGTTTDLGTICAAIADLGYPATPVTA